ncbi:neutral/alkaline non-lysosomal ceramidase N-terminal domain-containing protein [Parendozoicomonas sp. Alg238-R29]|uniref:neutral/alkaline non-lysosomal ceramidase N-terminal domain-containing protein n=1 Tax=Parendozoicomonas sp. Alg238-R29 TaxID=2993446 RepID=UPI00248E9117|nr:neutral/alkaline non-lysosomal ceramidase N-terminal domain-containing protein [Parendozoicomonas sp. Alg238-R29]
MKRLLITALFLLTGCSSVSHLTIQQPEAVTPRLESTMMAGVSSVDITPPPGLPMGGYSMMANKGKGFRTRLKARTVYLNDGQGKSMALIQMDLFAGSLLLQHQVASAVAEKTGLNPADIAVMGTHTHSAPANFHHNDFYNKHASSGAGLEKRFLDFVSTRIAEGVEEAWAKRRPAKVATGRKDIYGVNRNRSLASYKLNAGQENQDDVFKAVNPALYMIRVDAQDDDGSWKPLGAFSSFSIHATTISAPVDVYNADLFAYAQREVEWNIAEKYQPQWPVIHGLTTGAHGDMAPALPFRGDSLFAHLPVNWKESRDVGTKLGNEAWMMFEELGSELSDSLILRTAAREINIRENNKVAGVDICKDPAAGNALAGGAFERRTPWLAALPIFQGGNDMARRNWFTDSCHGRKRILGFSALQPIAEPKESFPTTVLFQLLQVNDLAILPLPFEVTAESGRRIGEQVIAEYRRAGDSVLKHAAVISTSNGYFGYTTTPEEYDRQNYEGGHTLYGRNMTPYISVQLGSLAEDLLATGNIQELLPEWSYSLKAADFLPEPEFGKGERVVLSEPVYREARKIYQEPYIAFRWQDAGVTGINLHESLVSVEVKTENGWKLLEIDSKPISDDGYDLEVRKVANAKNGMAIWETRWYNPADMKTGEYRFAIEPRGNSGRVYSKIF